MALLLRLPKSGLVASLAPASLLSARGFATGDPLKQDTRTTKSQEIAHETDEATKDSIRHAAEGEFKEAIKDVGSMAANAAKGAASSAKLMADSVKEKVTGKKMNDKTQADLKQGKP